MMSEKTMLYHVTVLSNFARGFDKYARAYSKTNIPESTYPDRFFLLRRHELAIGIEKASRLLAKLAIPGDRLIVLASEVDPSHLQSHETPGRGLFIRDPRIILSQVYLWKADLDDPLVPAHFEDVMAASLGLAARHMHDYGQIRPRAISFLPVANACQARCAFCFSKSSISSDQRHARPEWSVIERWLDIALARGAERAVITGGGEPTLLSSQDLLNLVSRCSHRFDKVVMITNAYQMARAPDAERVGRIGALHDAGLRVLAISRHHSDASINEQLMGLSTPTASVINTWRQCRDRWPQLRLRLICVLQKGGVDTAEEIGNYLSWASRQGVQEVCFKELYVSTSVESVYHDREANLWSRRNQVPLSLLTRFVEEHGFMIEATLPWGAPVYRGEWLGAPMRVAAYSEPSLYWERNRGIARSWNVLADGRCHVSLEDRASEISFDQVT